VTLPLLALVPSLLARGATALVLLRSRGWPRYAAAGLSSAALPWQKLAVLPRPSLLLALATLRQVSTAAAAIASSVANGLHRLTAASCCLQLMPPTPAVPLLCCPSLHVEVLNPAIQNATGAARTRTPHRRRSPVRMRPRMDTLPVNGHFLSM
jgi:hypothetical protein